VPVESMREPLDEYVDENCVTLTPDVANSVPFAVYENMYVMSGLHTCFCHALIDHVFPHFWAIRDIKHENPGFCDFPVLIRKREIHDYWYGNENIIKNIGQDRPRYKGAWDDLLNLISESDVFFEHSFYPDDHFIVKNCYFYKLDAKWQRSPWNCLEHYPQHGVRWVRKNETLFTDSVIKRELAIFRAAAVSKISDGSRSRSRSQSQPHDAPLRLAIINRRSSVRNIDDILEKNLTEMSTRWTPSIEMCGVVYLEDLSLGEQMRVFMDNDIILSPHGAGLIHSIWTSNTIIIELIFDEDDCPIYQRICDITDNHLVQIPLSCIENATERVNAFLDYMEHRKKDGKCESSEDVRLSIRDVPEWICEW